MPHDSIRLIQEEESTQNDQSRYKAITSMLGQPKNSKKPSYKVGCSSGNKKGPNYKQIAPFNREENHLPLCHVSSPMYESNRSSPYRQVSMACVLHALMLPCTMLVTTNQSLKLYSNKVVAGMLKWGESRVQIQGKVEENFDMPYRW